MTIHKKDDGLFCLTMKESELDELHTAIGGIKHLSTWAAMIEQVYETYYRWRVMENGFLRYEVKLVKPDGSSKVFEREATPHRCGVLVNRFEKLKRLGYYAELRVKVSKIVWPTFIKDN